MAGSPVLSQNLWLRVIQRRLARQANGLPSWPAPTRGRRPLLARLAPREGHCHALLAPACKRGRQPGNPAPGAAKHRDCATSGSRWSGLVPSLKRHPYLSPNKRRASGGRRTCGWLGAATPAAWPGRKGLILHVRSAVDLLQRDRDTGKARYVGCNAPSTMSDHGSLPGICADALLAGSISVFSRSSPASPISSSETPNRAAASWMLIRMS